jgi:hypothetical protein
VIRDFLVWMATELGKGEGDVAMSWSEALAGSLNFWGLVEGTHVLTLMLFMGTILMVDLRLLGVAFKRTPVSVLSERVLPLTIFGLVVMVITGAVLFYAKPLLYYHNIWFRLKLVFLVVAAINIMWFHFRIQRSMPAWDSAPNPPAKVRLSGLISLLSWIAIITVGRFIAYDWYECGKPQPSWVNAIQECRTSERGAVEKDAVL